MNNPLNSRLLWPINPEIYLLQCVYSDEEVRNDIFGERAREYLNHIIVCGSSDCRYFTLLSNLFAEINHVARRRKVTVATLLTIGTASLFAPTVGLTFAASTLLGSEIQNSGEDWEKRRIEGIIRPLEKLLIQNKILAEIRSLFNFS
jgi:hypothetical protein